jgi:hypothetical protein
MVKSNIQGEIGFWKIQVPPLDVICRLQHIGLEKLIVTLERRRLPERRRPIFLLQCVHDLRKQNLVVAALMYQRSHECQIRKLLLPTWLEAGQAVVPLSKILDQRFEFRRAADRPPCATEQRNANRCRAGVRKGPTFV